MSNDTMKNMRDQLRSTGPSDLARLQLSREVMGAKLTAQISPCVWMNKGYPLQVEVMMENGGNAFFIDKTLNFETATPARIEQMLSEVKVCKCKNKDCANIAFDPSTTETNRKGECEKCFMAKLKADFAKIQAKEDAKLKAVDARHKAKGYSHRVSAWVHPKAGGDDYQIDVYTQGRMKDEDVEKLLKKKGSSVTNDFQIVEL